MKLPPEELMAANVSANAHTPNPRLPKKYSPRKFLLLSKRFDSTANANTPTI